MSTTKPIVNISLNFGGNQNMPERTVQLLGWNVNVSLISLMKTLAIPGEVLVSINVGDTRINRFLQITANGTTCKFSDDLLRNVANSVYTTPSIFQNFSQWENSSQSTIDAFGNEDQFVDFISKLASEVLYINAAHLLGPDQFEAFWNTLNLSRPIPDHQKFIKAFKEVLALNISLHKTDAINPIIDSTDLDQRDSVIRMQEELIETLSSGEVIIHINEEYFREITATVRANEVGNPFQEIRNRLMDINGIHFSPLTFKVNKTLAYPKFQFQINSFISLPEVGLLGNQCLIDTPLESLGGAKVNGYERLNPLDGSLSTVISTTNEIPPGSNILVYGGINFIAWCLGNELRKRSHCFVTKGFTENALNSMGEAWAVVNALNNEHPVEFTTSILRRLTCEGVPIRDLRRISGAILDADYIEIDPRNFLVFDDRLPVKYYDKNSLLTDPQFYAEYVRAKLADLLTARLVAGNALYTFDFDIDNILEDRLSKKEDLSESDYERIATAVHKEIGLQPATVVTHRTLRPYLAEILRLSFPRLSVLAYTEISPSAMNVPSLKTISISAKSNSSVPSTKTV